MGSLKGIFYYLNATICLLSEIDDLNKHQVIVHVFEALLTADNLADLLLG